MTDSENVLALLRYGHEKFYSTGPWLCLPLRGKTGALVKKFYSTNSSDRLLYSLLSNVPSKLECYIAHSWKGLLVQAL